MAIENEDLSHSSMFRSHLLLDIPPLSTALTERTQALTSHSSVASVGPMSNRILSAAYEAKRATGTGGARDRNIKKARLLVGLSFGYV